MVRMAIMAGIAADSQLPIPRRCGRQTLRPNVESNTPAEYWSRSVFIPFLDYIIAEFAHRFSELSLAAIQALLLVPAHLESLTSDRELALEQCYASDSPEPHSFSPKKWRKKWDVYQKAGLPSPASLSAALLAAGLVSFPNITMILTIFLVAPVTTSTVERSNSVLAYVKTKLRSTMRQQRLNDLLLLYVHKNISLDVESVVDRFARRKPRRKLLSNALADTS